MSLGEGLINLRKRVADAVRLGVLDITSKDMYEATLIQIMNEAEKHRQRCEVLAEQYRRQAAEAQAQAGAYSQIGSVIYNVLNGFVNAAEKSKLIEKNQQEEKVELSNNEKELLTQLAKKQEKKKTEEEEEIKKIQKALQRKSKRK